MTQFVKCAKLGGGETVLLNLSAVKLVWRVDRDERADIVEDFDGNSYECIAVDEHICCPGIKSCVVSIEALDEKALGELAKLNECLENIHLALLNICNAICYK